MIPLDFYLAFCADTAVLLIIPGPNVALIVANSLAHGTRFGLLTVAATSTAVVFHLSLTVLGATALLMLWCLWRRIPLWQSDGSLRAGLVAGLLFALEFVCIYTGMQHTTASRLTIMLYTAPFWVALLLPIWLKHERLRPLQWVGLSLAFSGVAFALRDSLASGGSWLGDALSLAAGAMWGLTTVVLRTTALTRVQCIDPAVTRGLG